jgi:acyl-CoA reductase-like NAD-dependent aldehyde dehydrogenase
MADYGLTGIFNLVIGSGSEVGELLLNDARVELISFTGSTKIGRHVSEAARDSVWRSRNIRPTLHQHSAHHRA